MAKFLKYNDISFSVGDTVKVHFSVKDGEKSRVQIFEGIIIAIANRGPGKVLTVRKIAAGGVGVERIVPLDSPTLANLELVSQGAVRRGKLFYLRARVGKNASKIKKKLMAKIQPTV